jgi:hypothetical protein
MITMAEVPEYIREAEKLLPVGNIRQECAGQLE